MIHHKQQTVPGLILTTLLLSPLAQAETGPYVGASFGSSHFDEDFSGLNVDSDTNAFRVIGGFQLGDYFGIEAGYHDFGDFSESIDFGGFSSVTTVSADGWTLGGTLGLPLNKQFSLYGRAGVFFWDADVDIDGFSIDIPADENPYYGGGAKVDVTSNLSLVGDWTHYELDNIDSDVISLGFEFRFGR
ncbi:MAG: porin family protein [Gammaproteobacteria bacterium]|nr:porin family protein [Gammaproteobacteria bacterium]NNC55938.1 porin family protein [Woeseiaceae bacterium]NNL49963.1 porin family protein [Woeseiaceae bacterium]